MRVTRRELLLAAGGTLVACSRAGGGLHATEDELADSAATAAEEPPASARRLLVAIPLSELRARAERGDARWKRLRQRARRQLDVGAEREAENLAVAYLIDGEEGYARAAFGAAEELMRRDVRDDSYLQFGNILAPVAMVLDHCADALAPAESRRLADFLAGWAHELWFANRGSGWGLDDPGNNYHMAFLEGTAFAAYALARRADPRATALLTRLERAIEGPDGVLDYLRRRCVGGAWHEGANYGQRAKQRLLMALSAIATMGGPRYFDRCGFFDDLIYFAAYQLQPDRRSLHPAGDLARDSAMLVSPYDRDYLQLATYWSRDPRAKALGRWYLAHVVPSYRGEAFNYSRALYKDFLFASDGAELAPESLPRSYRASGEGWVTVRSSWAEDATCLCISAAPRLDQSHAHVDASSFTLFKGGWQAADATTFSRSGLCWEAGAHNMIHVDGHERRPATIRGLTRFGHRDGVAHAQIDASGLFRQRRHPTRPLLREYTREIVYLEPDTVVIYDRVEAPDDLRFSYRLHFPERPQEISPGLYQGSHRRGAMSLRVLLGGERRIVEDGDLEGGGSESWRVQIEPEGGSARFLTVLRVALGPAPELVVGRIDGSPYLDGVVLDGVVVVVSSLPHGLLAEEQLVYRVAASPHPRQHLVVGARGAFDVEIDRDGARTRISLARGHRHPSDGSGLLRFRA